MTVHRQGIDSYLRYSERKLLDEARRGHYRATPGEVVTILERLARERRGRRKDGERRASEDGSGALAA